MPSAIHSFEMTTELSCSYGKLRGTKLGGLMSGFPHLFLLCISLPAKVASTCATLCYLSFQAVTNFVFQCFGVGTFSSQDKI